MESTGNSSQDPTLRFPYAPNLNTSEKTMNDLGSNYYYEDQSWLSPSTEHLNQYSDIFEYCYHQLHPEITHYDVKLHVQLICDSCNLSEVGYQELFSDQTCLESDLNPMPLFIALFSAIFIFGAFGNLITLIAGIKSRKRHTSMSAMFLFISNLAAGDLLMAVLCVPITFVSTFYLHYWPFQKFFCVAVSYAQAVSVFVSAYSLVAISVDRYIAILYPPHHRINRRQAWAVLGAVWGMALLTCVPVALYSDLVVPGHPYYTYHNLTMCMENWPPNLLGVRQGYSITLMVLHYFLPVAVMVFTYSRIAWKIWKSSKAFKTVTLGKASSGDPPSPTSPSIPIKTIRMSLTVVLVYSLCWLPFNLLIVIIEYTPSPLEIQGSQYLYTVLYWLAMLHTVLDAVLIYLLNPHFRAAILRVLHPLLSQCCRGAVENRLRKLENKNSSIRFRRNTLRTSVSMAVHQGVNNNTAVHSGAVVRCVKALPCDEVTNHTNGSTRRSDSIKSTSTRSTSVRAYEEIASPTLSKVESDEEFDFADPEKLNNQDARSCKDAVRKAQLLEEPRGSIVKMFPCEEQQEICSKVKGKSQVCGDTLEMEEFGPEKREKSGEVSAPSKKTRLINFFWKKRKEETGENKTKDKYEAGDGLCREEAACFVEQNAMELKDTAQDGDQIDMEDDVFV